ncbi:hypothetical protein V8F33_011276 [Rhypophila sp. PSN 637]
MNSVIRDVGPCAVTPPNFIFEVDRPRAKDPRMSSGVSKASSIRGYTVQEIAYENPCSAAARKSTKNETLSRNHHRSLPFLRDVPLSCLKSSPSHEPINVLQVPPTTSNLILTSQFAPAGSLINCSISTCTQSSSTSHPLTSASTATVGANRPSIIPRPGFQVIVLSFSAEQVFHTPPSPQVLSRAISWEEPHNKRGVEFEDGLDGLAAADPVESLDVRFGADIAVFAPFALQTYGLVRSRTWTYSLKHPIDMLMSSPPARERSRLKVDSRWLTNACSGKSRYVAALVIQFVTLFPALVVSTISVKRYWLTGVWSSLSSLLQKTVSFSLTTGDETVFSTTESTTLTIETRRLALHCTYKLSSGDIQQRHTPAHSNSWRIPTSRANTMKNFHLTAIVTITYTESGSARPPPPQTVLPSFRGSRCRWDAKATKSPYKPKSWEAPGMKLS